MPNKIKKFFEVKNQTEEAVDLYIYGDIVSDSWDAWRSEDIYPEYIKDFLRYSRNKEINIYINSAGGNVIAGMVIYNIIKRHPKKTVVYIDGIAASIASVIALAADKVIMPNNAYMMIHKPYIACEGNAKELREVADYMDKLEGTIKEVYLANSELDEDELGIYLDSETWFTGAEASEIFNKIELTDSIEAVASLTGLNFKNKPADIISKSQEELENENLLFELELL